jgi:purine-cytosine permease-like protein
MGYWVTFFLAIVIEEDLLFRKNGYNWADWAEPSKLPVGLAALITFLTGWAWAVVSMDQTCSPQLIPVYLNGWLTVLQGSWGRLRSKLVTTGRTSVCGPVSDGR